MCFLIFNLFFYMRYFLLVFVFAASALGMGARDVEEGWKALGTGTFCDDMICFIDEQFLDTWEVEIEESTEKPGLFRLVNPFGNGNCPYFTKGFKANDLLIDATDPDHVWIPWQDMGFSIPDWGGFSVSCFNGLMILGGDFTIEELIGYDCMFGTLSEGRITFPDDDGYRLQASFEYYLEGLPADANTHNLFLVTLPSDDPNGIGDVVSPEEDSPVEFYNLQGVRVENPSGGVFIRRQGSLATKVVMY